MSAMDAAPFSGGCGSATTATCATHYPGAHLRSPSFQLQNPESVRAVAPAGVLDVAIALDILALTRSALRCRHRVWRRFGGAPPGSLVRRVASPTGVAFPRFLGGK